MTSSEENQGSIVVIIMKKTLIISASCRTFIKLNRYLIIYIIIAFYVLSCTSSNENNINKEDEDTRIHQTVERGPVMVQLDVDKKEITIADRLKLLITVTADEEYEIKLPGFGEKLEQFGIVDYHTSQPELVDKNKIKISRQYILEPFLSGDYTIPPMKIDFWKKGEAESDPHVIETEELTIQVSSLLPENIENLKIHDIKPPVSLPLSKTVWIWTAGLSLLAAVMIIMFFLFKIRSKRAYNDIKNIIPAHEIAYREIEQLVSEDLIEKGEIKRFYQRISNILRRYIENRFGLHAPEETTEEFLTDLETDKSFPDQYRLLLKKFLIHCDLVKFAEHQPDTDDIQKTFDSCRDFISGTEEKDNKTDS